MRRRASRRLRSERAVLYCTVPCRRDADGPLSRSSGRRHRRRERSDVDAGSFLQKRRSTRSSRRWLLVVPQPCELPQGDRGPRVSGRLCSRLAIVRAFLTCRLDSSTARAPGRHGLQRPSACRVVCPSSGVLHAELVRSQNTLPILRTDSPSTISSQKPSVAIHRQDA